MKKKSHDSYIALVYTTLDTALLIQELIALDNTVVRLPSPGARWARLSVFCPSQAAARQAADRLHDFLHAAPRAVGRVCCAHVPAADWRENWKKHFPARRVSPRLVVKPSWRAFRARPGDRIIELDPGLSFGTGLHPTTRGCLRLLDEFCGTVPSGSFLDIGCGSGILAIAAARLGLRPVLALDNDPQAVRATRQNRDANGLTRQIICRQSDVMHLARPTPFNFVAANLLAGLLIDAAPQIARTVSATGRLTIAGILCPQYPTVLRAYRRQGFREIKHIVDGEWQTGILSRQ